MKTKKHLGISGGGTKIAGLYGACEVIMKDKGFKPDIISGISAGAVLSVPLALGKFDAIKERVLDFDLKDFFSELPVKDSGKLTFGAIWKAITGKPYLGRQGNLEKTLSEIVTKSEFETWKEDKDSPECWVGTVDFYSAERWYFNLKGDPDIDYGKFLKLVNASASIPIFTNAIQVRHENRDLYLYDGGVRDHCPTAYMMEHPDYANTIAESVSVYSRPEHPSLAKDHFSDKNVLKILGTYTDITNIEVSKNDERQEREIAAKQGIKLWQLYMPAVMKSVYDTNPDRLRKLYMYAREEATTKYPDNPIVLDGFI